MSADEFRKEFEKFLDELRNRVRNLAADVEKLLDSGDVREAHRVWRERSRKVVKELKEYVEKLEKMSESIDEKIMREIVSEFKDRVNEVIEEVSNIFNDIVRKFKRADVELVVSLPFWRCKVPRIFIRSFEDIFDSMAEIFKSIEEAMERLEDVARSKLSNVISARIGKKELELIDQLVDAGVFRSRSEAIAYFVRRGIESSKEWIEKTLEKIKKIKELQESIRKELEDLDKNNK